MLMKKSFLLAAVAITALAGCTDEQFEGQNVASQGGGSLVIKMGTGSPEAITRADKTGKDAAGLLNNNFIVEGFKSEGSTTTLTNPVEVFRYYNVNYYENTENSTESNSHGWEYVSQIPVAIGDGKEFITGAGFTPVNSQTIKYWDTDYAQYDFVAFSRGTGAIVTTPSADTTYAQFSAVDPGKIGMAAVAGNEVYTINGTNAEIGTAYVADLVTVEKSEANDNYRKANPVTPRFRKLAAKIRMAIYETVPGYSVKDVRFYTSAAGSAETTAAVSGSGTALKDNKPTLISVEADDVFKTDKEDIPSQDGTGKVSVFYPITGSDNKSAEGYNKAQIKFIPAETGTNLTSTLQFDTLVYGAKEADETAGGNIYLGRKSNQATYAGTQTSGETVGTDYIDVIPTGDSHVLKLRVAYTLVPTDGGDEIIVMEDATAVVPAQYAEWQPNYAYTYIFKISEKSGEGLYPITFDALVMDSEDGIQETITEVSDPSITTYQKGKIVTENDEYLTGDSIFVVVDNGKALSKALSKTTDGVGYVRLFNAVLTPAESATAPNAATALQSITEATAENCFEKGTYDGTGKTWTVTDAAGATLVLTDATEGLDIQKQIGADHTTNGLTWTINNAQFLPAEVGYYVFQYETAAAVLYSYEEYKALEGNGEVTEGEFDALTDAEKTKTPAKYMYKVIKVAQNPSSAPAKIGSDPTDKQYGKAIR